MYPTTYTLGDRVVSGNITQYITSNNSATFQSFDTSATVGVKTIVNNQLFKCQSYRLHVYKKK